MPDAYRPLMVHCTTALPARQVGRGPPIRPLRPASCRDRYHTDRHPGDVAEYTGSAPRAVDTLDSFTWCRQIRMPRQGHPHAAGVLRRSRYWREQVLFTIRMSYRC
jgi:hypothetical protein